MKMRNLVWMTLALLLFLADAGGRSALATVGSNADGLSEETLDWLDWYNALPEDQQRAVSSLPPDLLEQSGLAQTEDAEAEDS